MPADDGPAVVRGESFRGRALEGVDFGGRDLRGVDFTGANLRSASFRDARVGPKPLVGAAILSTAIVAAVGAGVLIGLAVEATREGLYSGNLDEILAAGMIIVTLAVVVALIFLRGFGIALKVAAVVYLCLVVVTFSVNLIWGDVEWQALTRTTLALGSFVLGIWAGVIGRLMVGLFGRWSLACMTVLGALAAGQVEGGIAGIVLALSVSHFSHRAGRFDDRDVELLDLAYGLVSRTGTRFIDADLTDADFRGVDLNKCDMTGATLDGARWDSGQRPPRGLSDDAA